MKRFKTAVSLLLTATMFFSLAACGGDKEEATTTTNTEVSQKAETSVDDGKATATVEEVGTASGTTDKVIIGVTVEPDSVAPGTDAKTNSQWLSAMCYDTLLGKSNEDESVLVPSIASDWTFNEDGTEILFTIRDDIKFHDGTALTVEDVVYSLSVYAPAQTMNSAGASMITGVEDAGNNQVKVTLAYPYKPILYIIATPGYGIVDKETHEAAVAENKNFNIIENGTGAYKIASWSTGEKVVLEANPDWHRATPAINTIEYKLCSDATSGALMMENGELDVFSGINNADRNRLASNENIDIIDNPSAGTHIIAMNQTEGSVFADNLALREAVAYAINREEMILGGLDGAANVTPDIITPGYFGYSQGDYREQDQEMAKQKLTEAGYPDGIDLVFKTPSDSWYAGPAQVAIEQMRQVGIRCETVVMERATYFQEVHENLDYDMAYYMTWGEYPDADQQAWPCFHSTSIGAQMGNFIGLVNPEVDALLEKARASTSDDERLELYTQLNDWNHENVWWLFTSTGYNTVCKNKALENLYPVTSLMYNPGFWTWAN